MYWQISAIRTALGHLACLLRRVRRPPKRVASTTFQAFRARTACKQYGAFILYILHIASLQIMVILDTRRLILETRRATRHVILPRTILKEAMPGLGLGKFDARNVHSTSIMASTLGFTQCNHIGGVKDVGQFLVRSYIQCFESPAE